MMNQVSKMLFNAHIKGQYPVCVYMLKDGRYFVTYGAEETVHHTMVSALDDFHECVKHALACAGHDVGGEGW